MDPFVTLSAAAAVTADALIGNTGIGQGSSVPSKAPGARPNHVMDSELVGTLLNRMVWAVITFDDRHQGWRIKRRTLRPLDGSQPAREILGGALDP